MAIKFTDLPQLSGTPADTDIVAIVDVSEDVSKKITVADLVSATGLDAASVRTIVEGSDLDMGSNKVLFSNMYATEGDLPDATSYHGMFAHVHATGAAYFAHGGSWVKLANFADMPSAVDTSAIEADIDALETKVGSSDLTTPSTASSISYEEVLDAVHTVVTTASDKITWRQSDNYASTATVDRFNTNNTRWDQNFEPNRGTIGTDDALIMAFEDESKIVEYPLDANAINNDNPSVEYNGLSAGDNIGKYVRCMYADDDILVASTGDSTGFVYIWTRGANGSTPISISRPGSSSDWESWGSTVKRVNDYLIVGGYKLFTVHNLDGSFVQTVGPFGSVLPDSNGMVGGQPSISGSVAIANYGNTLVIGAPNTDSTKGRAMVFDLNDLSLPPTVLSPPTPLVGQHFGISCDVSDDYIVIGGHQHWNGSGDHRGRVAVYDRSSLNLIKNIIPEGNYLHYQGKFGTAVSIRGNTLLVGARGIEPFSNGLRGGILIFDLTDLDAAPTIFAGPDGDQNFPRVMSVSPNVDVTQTVNATIVPSADVSSAINYLEDKTNDMQASIAAAASSADIATAKSEAISTAAADATTKADQAEADAKAYADQVVAATVDAAPASLDTLNELAAALNDDANFASTVTASIAAKADQTDVDTNTASISTLQSSVGGTLTVPSTSTSITYDQVAGSQWSLWFTTGNDRYEVKSSDVTSASLNSYLPHTPVVYRDNVISESSNYVYSYNGTGPIRYAVVDGSIVSSTFEQFSCNFTSFKGMYADDDILVIAHDDSNNGQIAVYDVSGSSSASEITPNYVQRGTWDYGDDDFAWGYNITRIDDYILVSGNYTRKYATLHNLDGSFASYLFPPDIDSLAYLDAEGWGSASLVTENHVIIAMDRKTISQAQQGGIYVYDRASFPGGFITKVERTDTAQFERFGKQLAYHGNKLFVGGEDDSNSNSTKGKIWVYDLTDFGNTPNTPFTGSTTTIIDSPDNDYRSRFGARGVHVKGDVLIVGARGVAEDISGQGAIYFFDVNDLSAAPTYLEFNNTDDNFPRNLAFTAEVPIVNTVTESIVPSSGIVSAINYLENKTNSATAAVTSSDVETAKSEAISTAAADATAKADQAEADAKAYADQVVAATVDAAPAALDTLNELAAALGDDANFASTVTASIATKADASALAAKADASTVTAVMNSVYGSLVITDENTELTWTRNGPTSEVQVYGQTDPQTGTPSVAVLNNTSTAKDVAYRDLTVAAGVELTLTSLVNPAIASGSTDWPQQYFNYRIEDNGSVVATLNGGDKTHSYTFTPSSTSVRIWVNITNTGLYYINDFSVSAEEHNTSPTLDTVAQGVVGAINELHTEISNAPAGVTSADVATAKSEAMSYADQVVAATVDAAPAALDTLNELAAALGDDANFASTVTASIATKADQSALDALETTVAGMDTSSIETDVSALESYIQAAGSAKMVVGVSTENKVLVYNTDGTLEHTIAAPTDAVNFGTNIASNGSKIVVSASGYGISPVSASAIYVFDMDGSNMVKIINSDGHSGDQFGKSPCGIAISDSKIVVGAPNSRQLGGSDHADRTGAVYVYNLDGTGEVKILPSDIAKGEEFGNSVAINSSKVIVGSEDHATDGAAYVFNLDGTGELKLNSVAGGSSYAYGMKFGASVAISETKMAVGSLYSGPGERGSVHVYDIDGSNRVDIYPSTGSGRQFGYDVALNSSKVVVGYTGDDTAWIYDLDGTNEIQISTPAGAGQFGLNVAATETKIVVGSKTDSLGGVTMNGAAYIYDIDGTNELQVYDPTASNYSFFGEWIDFVQGAASYVTLQTTAQTVGEAINELHTEISSSSSSIQTSSDVDTGDTVAEGDVLVYDASSSHFGYVNLEGEVNSRVDAKIATTSVQGLSDVASSGEDTLAGGDFLLYDASTSKFGLVNFESEVQSYANAAANTAVANVVDAAPASLDTLNELAAALGDDANFASTVTASIATKADQTELDSLDAFVKGSVTNMFSGNVYSAFWGGMTAPGTNSTTESTWVTTGSGRLGLKSTGYSTPGKAMTVGNSYTLSFKALNIASTMTVKIFGANLQSAANVYANTTVAAGDYSSSPLQVTIPFTSYDNGVTVELTGAGAGTYALEDIIVFDPSQSVGTLDTTATNVVSAINELHGEMVSSSAVTALIDSDHIQANMPAHITDINYIQTTRIDMAQNGTLNARLGTADFEGSIVNFGSATVSGLNVNPNIDAHLNVSAADSNEFLKWNGTDYEFTDYIQGRLATTQLEVGDGGSITASLPSSTLDWQDGLVHFGGSEVIISETPTSANHAANKAYVDTVVAATVDAAPAALDTLNELAAALGDDANFASTVTASIATKVSQTDFDTLESTVNAMPDASALETFVKGEETASTATGSSGVVSGNTISGWKKSNGTAWTGAGVGYGDGIDMPRDTELAYLELPAGTHQLNWSSTGPSGIGLGFYAIPTGTAVTTNTTTLAANALAMDQSPTEYDFQNTPAYWEFTVNEAVKLVIVSPTINAAAVGNGYRTYGSLQVDSFTIASPQPTLETTATQVVPAINELHTEINTLSAAAVPSVSPVFTGTVSAGSVSANNFIEGVDALSGTSASIDPSNGSLITHTLTGTTTYSYAAGWGAGESVTLHIVSAGNTVNWPTTKWVGGSAPDLSSTAGTHLVNLWKVGSDVYGAYVGEAS